MQANITEDIEEEFCDCVFTGDVADASQCALHQGRRDNSEFREVLAEALRSESAPF